ncbi:hypothetical protein P153DRAFT_255629, partial [Dothidotthia symphoricarpi CBS 119687]
AQCPNTVASYNPALRTMSSNNTWFIVPVPKAAVQQALSESYPAVGLVPNNRLSLLDVPNFPAGMHPVLVTSGYSSDIRQSILQIDGPLLVSDTQIPFVGKGTSKKPLLAPLNTYQAGTSDQANKDLAAVVPAAVSTLIGGLFVRLGNFIPGNAAYTAVSNGLFSANSKWVILPNPASGPGAYVEAIDLSFTTVTEAQSKYSLTFLKSVINQPQLLNGILSGKCQRNTYFLTNATAEVEFRSGNVTLGAAASGSTLGLTAQTMGTLQKASPDGFGNYIGAGGFSGCAQVVGYNTTGPLGPGTMGEDCDEAS